jgi:hypothetical protein
LLIEKASARLETPVEIVVEDYEIVTFGHNTLRQLN